MGKLHAHFGGDGAEPLAIVARANMGDAVAERTVAVHLDLLGHALAGLVLAYDPHAIVLGGGLSKLPHLYDRLPAAVKRHLFPGVHVPPILPPRFGDAGGARGVNMMQQAENPSFTLSPIQQVIKAHRRGERVGLYAVCCSHPSVLRAAMRVASEYDTVLLVEATSNQVDQFGGYTGMTPAVFRDTMLAMAREQGFPAERLVLGGDHLGPNAWQHLDAATAMDHAETLIAAYASAGFHKIHLDCSMRCADDPLRLDDDTVAARSARLCQVAEDAAAAAGFAPPVYVIGTE
eukprot:gene23081-27671_t